MFSKLRKSLSKFLPGIISGGADNDPAAISTYSIAGAQFGYQQLWLLILSTPMLIAIQAMCARLGDVKRKGLMSIIREHFSPAISISAAIIIIITNLATLGADLSGVADVLGFVTHTPYLIWIIPLTLFIWYIEIFNNYRLIEKYFSILTLIFLSYIISSFLAKPDWGSILSAIFLPKIVFTPEYFLVSIGLLGATFTPYIFFWQSRQDLEEHLSVKNLNEEAKKEDVMLAPGYIYSNIISFFIIISTGTLLHNHGITQILSASDAAKALTPFAGDFSAMLFAIGIVGAGLLAIPVLAASTGYVIAETFGWREYLSGQVNREKGFYTVISISLIIGAVLVYSGINPLKALFYSQTINGILVPFLIILILVMCNDKKIMGKYINGWFDNVFGIITIIILFLGSSGLFWQLIIRH